MECLWVIILHRWSIAYCRYLTFIEVSGVVFISCFFRNWRIELIFKIYLVFRYFSELGIWKTFKGCLMIPFRTTTFIKSTFDSTCSDLTSLLPLGSHWESQLLWFLITLASLIFFQFRIIQGNAFRWWTNCVIL